VNITENLTVYIEDNEHGVCVISFVTHIHQGVEITGTSPPVVESAASLTTRRAPTSWVDDEDDLDEDEDELRASERAQEQRGANAVAVTELVMRPIPARKTNAIHTKEEIRRTVAAAKDAGMLSAEAASKLSYESDDNEDAAAAEPDNYDDLPDLEPLNADPPQERSALAVAAEETPAPAPAIPAELAHFQSIGRRTEPRTEPESSDGSVSRDASVCRSEGAPTPSQAPKSKRTTLGRPNKEPAPSPPEDTRPRKPPHYYEDKKWAAFLDYIVDRVDELSIDDSCTVMTLGHDATQMHVRFYGKGGSTIAINGEVVNAGRPVRLDKALPSALASANDPVAIETFGDDNDFHDEVLTIFSRWGETQPNESNAASTKRQVKRGTAPGKGQGKGASSTASSTPQKRTSGGGNRKHRN
jgi:hypothetical protein